MEYEHKKPTTENLKPKDISIDSHVSAREYLPLQKLPCRTANKQQIFFFRCRLGYFYVHLLYESISFISFFLLLSF